ncbi:ribonuclease P protein subunit p25-like protein [Hoplias malabaricus]|uniref:ribonuclease P protein subunit p25-like protein n=1 Tax=Hoplias malabaricus TaxID=27720 RepID=UPI0034633052
MENYRKAGVVEQPCACPFTELRSDTPEVRVRDGSKIRNLMKFALSQMVGKQQTQNSGAAEEVDVSGEPSGHPEKSGEPAGRLETSGEPPEHPETSGEPAENLCRQIVFTGAGPSVAKTITCVEILKRRVRGLHQCTRLLYRTVQEIWEPLEPDAGLDNLTVSRNIPGIWVLLSRDPLDSNLPGYQAPGSFDALWAQACKEEAQAQRHQQKRKRGGGGRGGGPGRGTGRGKDQRKRTGHSKDGRKTPGQE